MEAPCSVPTIEPTQEEVDGFVWMEVAEDGSLVDPDDDDFVQDDDEEAEVAEKADRDDDDTDDRVRWLGWLDYWFASPTDV